MFEYGSILYFIDN